jgi:hypothetical protein
MMEQDRSALCGQPWKPDATRLGRRAGSTESPVTLGGRRLLVRRPRVRSLEDGELALPSYTAAAKQDPLDRHTLEALAAGVSTRRYGRTLGSLPPGKAERATSKLGIVEGTTENAAVAKALLSDLVERGLSTERALLFVIDGSKALRKAITATFGDLAVIQRCPVHKRRNVLEHLPQSVRPSVKRALDDAWNADDAALAQRQLERLARSLETEHPGAAASLREGLEETLTLLRLGITGTLLRSLRSTNAIESVNDKIASYARRVKRWRGGQMILRWVGAAVLDARDGFRRVKGHREMHRLVDALRRHEKTLHPETEAA